ncbi:hypothetical protein FACS1894217_03920 [Clostridia bacterium]|nr:hypothetical protein FACS1894217_03920 [Clostridia bacterium]
MKSQFAIIIAVFLLVLGGCGANQDVTSLPPQNMEFINEAVDISTFAISNDGDVFTASHLRPLTRYTYAGVSQQEYPEYKDLAAVCVYNGNLYAYKHDEQQIVTLGADGDTQSVAEFHAENILNMVGHDGYLYVLAEDDGLKFCKINLKNAKITNSDDDGVLAIYAASDGKLYYYVKRGDNYELILSNGKKVRDMNEVGNIFAFVYESDSFVYAKDDATLNCINTKDGSILNLGNIYIDSGKNMKFYAGNVVYLGASWRADHYDLKSFYLPDLTSNPTQTLRGKITVSAPWSNALNFNNIKQKSGIEVKSVVANSDQQAQLTKIMAGDPTVDIYLLSSSDVVSIPLRDKGIYIPLSDSGIISDYLNKCFDYVADAAKAPSGDVWALPYSSSADALWYRPENTEKLGLTPNNVLLLDDYISTIKKLKTQGYQAVSEYPMLDAFAYMTQYEAAYNDYMNNVVKFETPEYKHLFEILWGGWNRYGNELHPIFGGFLAGENDGQRLSDKKIVYAPNRLNASFDWNEWRALPFPRVSSKVEHNVAGVMCAMINPYSEQKDLALAFLEAMAADPFGAVSGAGNAGLPLIFKDKIMYEKQYDISSPTFDDIYNIMSNGVIISVPFPYGAQEYIDDYQNGRLTLDEAVAVQQREAEMWLNE